ncbi:MAG TPA: hypothetical protein VLK58_26895 [Conexibacter sp.]|nr:hypothetical protein [Conexibacter sp.]
MTDDAQLSDYLLGELDPAARERFEERLAREPELRAQAERLAPAVARLESLPEQAWDALPGGAGSAAGAGVGAQAGAGRGRAAGGPRRWLPAAPRSWAATALAAVALLGAGIGIGVLVDGDGGGTRGGDGPAVVLAPLDSARVSAGATARMTGPNRMLLTIEDLPPAPAGSYYEAWLLNDPDDLVPVASFSVGADGRAVVEVPLPAAADRYRYLDVSLQRVDGGTEHSSDSVLRGALS